MHTEPLSQQPLKLPEKTPGIAPLCNCNMLWGINLIFVKVSIAINWFFFFILISLSISPRVLSGVKAKSIQMKAVGIKSPGIDNMNDG